MALIAKVSISHDNMDFEPGQHVDATGADKERLITLNACEERADNEAVNETKLRRTGKTREQARAAQVAAKTAKAEAEKLAAEAAEAERRSKLTPDELAKEDAERAAAGSK